MVHLVLGEAAVARVTTWDQATEEDGLTIQSVPHIESGHPGPIPVCDVAATIVVDIERDPFLERLREASRPRGGTAAE